MVTTHKTKHSTTLRDIRQKGAFTWSNLTTSNELLNHFSFLRILNDRGRIISSGRSSAAASISYMNVRIVALFDGGH